MADHESGWVVNAIEVAREIERRGIALYKRASRVASAEELRALLLRLMDEETTHLNYFESLADTRARLDETSGSLASALAAEAYLPGGLMQMAGEGAFESADKLLDAAIKAENDSIEFYGKLAGSAPDDVRARIEEILDQERAHLSELTGWKQGNAN
ncbi:MAG: hypothetical protein LBH66_06960 [Oscillospiraceae bacterium]|jgi:rubrerythrin|nr:hypothetical protein [Oscillospiraceae bacterium]